MEDEWSRDFLVQHAKDQRNDIEFLDYSVQDPFDSSWKTQCRERISRTRGTIVMIGKTTYLSDAVKWEIDETNNMGHGIFGIQISGDNNYIVPSGIPSTSVIRWSFQEIVRMLSTWE